MYQPIDDEPVLAKELGRSFSSSFSRATSAFSRVTSGGQSGGGGGRRSRDKPPFLAKYAGKILITVVVSAVLLCDMRGLTTRVDRFKSRHHMQTLTDAVPKQSEAVQFRIPQGAAPGGLLHILLPGSDTPQAVEIPKNAVPGEMMSVQVPLHTSKLAGAEDGVGEEVVEDIKTGNVVEIADDVEFSFTHYILVIFVVVSGIYVIYLSCVGVFVGFGPLQVDPKLYMDHPARLTNPRVAEMAEEAKYMVGDTPRSPGAESATSSRAAGAGAEGKTNLNRVEQYNTGLSDEQKAVAALQEEGDKMKGDKKRVVGGRRGSLVKQVTQMGGTVGKRRSLTMGLLPGALLSPRGGRQYQEAAASPRSETSPRKSEKGPKSPQSAASASGGGRSERVTFPDKVEERKTQPSPREGAASSPRRGGGGRGGGEGARLTAGAVGGGGLDFAGNDTIWEVWGRGKWLAGLMILQSFSTTIFASVEDVVRAQPVVAMFMLMLVGVGANAGAQAVVRSAQRIATDGYAPGHGVFHRHLEKEFPVSVWLALLLAWFACGIVWTGQGGPSNAVAVAFSCGIIVVGSVLLGTALPFAFHRFDLDTIHSGPVMQVLAGIWAMVVTCLMCSLFLVPTIAPQTSG